jgi:protein-histidine N-methyltransferase
LPPNEAQNTGDGGDLTLNQDLISAFTASLKSRNIEIRLFSGAWSQFAPKRAEDGYDIILTSETIYQSDSLPSLITLLKKTKRPSSDLVEGIPRLSLSEESPLRTPLILVAAKILYFGVGGGVSDFVKAVKDENGTTETVLESKDGVGRCILQVNFLAPTDSTEAKKPLIVVDSEGMTCTKASCGW